MTQPSNDRLTDAMQDIEELRAELSQIRRQQIQSIKNRWRLRIGLLAASLVVVSSWAWSAQSTDPALVEIEKRLRTLESLIRKGPGDTTQVTGPLDVIGPDGKHVLVVRDAGLEIMNPAGKVVAYVGTNTAGDGTVTVSDQKGTERASMEGNGLITVWNPQGNPMVRLWDDAEKGGHVMVFDPKGSPRAAMSGFGVVNVINAAKLQVAALTVGEDDLGRVAIFDNNKKVVEMIGSGDGSGYIHLSDQGKAARSILAPGAFALFDKDGHITVEADADAAGGGQVRVGDKHGSDRAVMGVTSAGGYLFVTDTKDALRASISGEGKVIVYDKEMNEAGNMYVTPEGRGGVEISDKDKLRVSMGVDGGSDGYVATLDAQSKVRASVSGSGEIAVHDKDENEVAGMHDRAEQGGRVTVSHQGNLRAAMGIGNKEAGKDAPQAPLHGGGVVVVFNEKSAQVAGISSAGDGNGRVSVWSNDEKNEVLARLTADKGGQLNIMNAGGTLVAQVRGGVADKGGKLNIMNGTGTLVAQVKGGEKEGGLVAVANSAAVPLVQMSVSGDGRGLVQVFKRTGVSPIAVLTESVETIGGLLQITGSSGSVSNILGGKWQLADETGRTTVEAGTLPDGRGTVRAGPAFTCRSARTPLFSGGTGDCIVGSSGGGAS